MYHIVMSFQHTRKKRNNTRERERKKGKIRHVHTHTLTVPCLLVEGVKKMTVTQCQEEATLSPLDRTWHKRSGTGLSQCRGWLARHWKTYLFFSYRLRSWRSWFQPSSLSSRKGKGIAVAFLPTVKCARQNTRQFWMRIMNYMYCEMSFIIFYSTEHWRAAIEK